MSDVLTIKLPDGSAPADATLLSEALGELPAVESARPRRTRSDLASIALLVELAGSAFTVVATAVPIIQKIIGTIRGKGIKGAVIEFPNGGKLTIDSASVEDIERLVRAARI
jgi:hypothetical protein